MNEPELSPENLANASRTLEVLRRRLDEVSPDDPVIAALLQQLSWLQGELRKRRRRDLGPPPGNSTRRCYVCRQPVGPDFRFRHLCPGCTALNETKRSQTADCRGRIVLLTGGRVKIGYQIGLKLLRAGAQVVVTTRFPRDAACRYTTEADVENWSDRLHLVPLDLRCIPAVEKLASWFAERWPRIDILIHNAAQTVRRPPAFYQHLVEAERQPVGELPAAGRPMLSCAGDLTAVLGLTLPIGRAAWSTLLSQVPLLSGDELYNEELFPPGMLDTNGQQVDRRPLNSWHWLLPDVPTIELVEVHAVNCIAPFVLLRDLLPLFRAGPPRDRFAVMV